MSVLLMGMCWERYPNGGGELLLALALADHAHDDGTKVYPSVSSLAEKTRQSRRTVQYQLRKMEQMGWLQLVAKEGGGRGKAREYRINPDWVKGADIAPLAAQEKGAEPAPLAAEKDAKDAPFNEEERVQYLRPPNDKGRNPEQERAQLTTQKGAIAVAPEPSGTVIEPSVKDISPCRRVFDHWISVMGKDPARTKLTADRRRRIQARLNDYPIEDVLRAIDGCAATPWNMGDNPARAMHNDIELICRSGSNLERFRDTALSAPKPRRFADLNYDEGVNPDGTFG